MRTSRQPPFEQVSVPEARRLYRVQADMLGGPIVPIAAVSDHVGEVRRGRSRYASNRPRQRRRPMRPALVYYHGGGWVIGGIETHDRVCRQIADRAGCAVVSVEYRLAPSIPPPPGPRMPSQPCHGFTPSSHPRPRPGPLAVGGDSAGGSLSAVSRRQPGMRGSPCAARS